MLKAQPDFRPVAKTVPSVRAADRRWRCHKPWVNRSKTAGNRSPDILGGVYAVSPEPGLQFTESKLNYLPAARLLMTTLR
jgi:hypothetical protein